MQIHKLMDTISHRYVTRHQTYNVRPKLVLKSMVHTKKKF